MYLNCHTYYSLRYGVLSPEELVDLAVQSGISSLVLSDINNTSCAFQFITACRKNGIKPILGIEFRNEEEFLYLGIARNDEGWRELCALLTEYSLRQEALPKESPMLPNCYIVFRKLPKAINSLRDNEYIGVRPEEVNQLFSSYLKEHLHKLVVFAPVTLRDEDGFKAHKLLRCIDLNIVLSRLKPENCARQGEYFRGPGEINQLYERYPVILQNTQRLLAACHTAMDSSIQHNRLTFTGDVKDDMDLLTKLAVSGCQRRYGARNKKATERTQKELKVIQKMGFCAYFLIT